MRKYFLIGLLILAFSLVGFTQTIPKFKIENFVKVKADTDKTAIYIGDRFEFRIEIVYPKDWGIEILTEDLTKESMATMLPDVVTIEKAEVSQPIPWNKYWLKIEAVYTLFYPEKKHDIGILFSPWETEAVKPIKIRFKWIDPEDKELKKDVLVHEINIKPFVLGVRTTLTDTSSEPRDSKRFFGNFDLKAYGGLIVGFVIILFGLSIPVKALILSIKNKYQRGEKTSIRQLLKNEYKRLNAVREISDLREFSDSFGSILRSLIEVKTGLKAKSMTAGQIKERIVGGDKHLVKLAELLEDVDEFRYNPQAKPFLKGEALTATENALCSWQGSKWHEKLRIVFSRLVKAADRMIKKRKK